MTMAKIAIALPPEQLSRVRRAVKQGRAPSVSAYIVRAIAGQEREESLAGIVRDLVATYGEPTAREKAWARRVLARTGRG